VAHPRCMQRSGLCWLHARHLHARHTVSRELARKAGTASVSMASCKRYWQCIFTYRGDQPSDGRRVEHTPRPKYHPTDEALCTCVTATAA
jgi:hypothetical protein